MSSFDLVLVHVEKVRNKIKIKITFSRVTITNSEPYINQFVSSFTLQAITSEVLTGSLFLFGYNVMKYVIVLILFVLLL